MASEINSELSRLRADAPALIGRLIGAAQEALARDVHLPNISYCSLLLKMGAGEVAQEFVRHFSIGPGNSDALADDDTPLFSLELATFDAPDPVALALQTSTARFKQLRAQAKAAGVAGLAALDKEKFLAFLRAGLTQARIDAASAERLMPYLAEALDQELLSIYGGIATRLAAVR